MGVETVAAALEREHGEIDDGIETFAAGLSGAEPDPEPLTRAVATLRRHIYLEEEFLFPPLRAAGLIAPVFVMQREHGQMWQLLDTLEAELRTGIPATVAEHLRDLQEQLRAHNPKEERILYPQAGQVLTESATATLWSLLKEGQVPDGWVCQALRSS